VDTKQGRNPFASKSPVEVLKKYGEMFVNSAVIFSLNRQTGDLQVTYKEKQLGSNIATDVTKTVCTVKDGQCQ